MRIDYEALHRAKQMKDRPMAPGAKMSGGDKPLWNADMEFWLFFDVERCTWWKDESEVGILSSPYYIASKTDCYETFEISGVIDVRDKS